MSSHCGTRRGYDIERCRCDDCRAVNADRVRRWRAGPQPHRWRERIVEEWALATAAWESQLEAESLGYGTEAEEFRGNNPPPLLRDFMVSLAAA